MVAWNGVTSMRTTFVSGGMRLAGSLALLCLRPTSARAADGGTAAWETAGLALLAVLACGVWYRLLAARGGAPTDSAPPVPPVTGPGAWGPRWAHDHLELTRRLRHDTDPTALAESILRYLAAVHEAAAGAFYLVRPGRRLILAAEHGEPGCGAPARVLELGLGQLGRAAVQGRIRAVSDADDPDCGRYRIIAPFHLAGQVIGMLVLECRAGAPAPDLEFLRQSAEGIAVALDAAQARTRVQRLLDATRRQAQKLVRQQRELKATNAELSEADRYKSEFLANISHELRTPLNSMLIMSQVLAENTRNHLDADEVEAARTINRAGGELLALIDDILDFTRVEAGRVDLQFAPVDPRALAAQLAERYRGKAAANGLEFVEAVSADTPASVRTDAQRVVQILGSLLDNAFKFTSRGSVVLTVRRLRADEGEGAGDRSWVAFEVADTGIGMSDETAARIFTPFKQGDGSTARRHGGSGLGLSISHRLAQLLGGRLDVRSAAGQGSTFVLALPAADEPVQPDADAPARRVAVADERPDERWAGTLTGLTVLLAEDDMRTVYGMSHLLAAMGAVVWTARRADETLDLANREPGHDLLCINPRLFAARGDDLRGLVVGEDAAGRPPCIWLGEEPDDGADWLPEDAVTLEKPVDAARFAEACLALVEREVQSV